MYAASYPLHDPLRNMDPRSRGLDDPYGHAPPNWQMLAHAQYPDLGVSIPPQAGPSAHVSSPLSTPSIGHDNSPVEYFGAHNVAQGQQEVWGMQQAHQGERRAFFCPFDKLREFLICSAEIGRAHV